MKRIALKIDVDTCRGTLFGVPTLIELLQRQSLTLAELHSDIVRLTQTKSQGFQIPDAPAVSEAAAWAVKPVPPSPP